VATVELGDISLYYEQHGEGEPLLFISGTGSDLRNKPNAFDGPLAKSFSVLAYDQRGLGQSSIPDGPYSMAHYGADVAGLLDALGWDTCLIVGVSFGGMVAQEFAVTHPERVRRLVLACTSPGGAGGSSYPLQELAGLAGRQRAERGLEIADVRWGPEGRVGREDEWSNLVDLMENMASANAPTGEDQERRELGMTLQLEARSHHDTWDRLANITCPTLVCGGRFDGIAPPENSEHLAERIPDAELALFDGGHMFLIQDPAAFGRIMEFLGRAT
jgi:3-oxoadipate enol-lactonase